MAASGSGSPLSRALVPLKTNIVALVVPKGPSCEPEAVRPKRQVLSEEEYVQNLQKIIQRDFFPDVEKLRSQKEYLEAEECGDLEKMRQISIKLGTSTLMSSQETPLPYITPATFETPTGVPNTPSLTAKRGIGDEAVGEKTDGDADDLPGLDSFLAKHTSEDNDSFEQIMEVAKEKERSRNAWLYEAEEEYKRVYEGTINSKPSMEKSGLKCQTEQHNQPLYMGSAHTQGSVNVTGSRDQSDGLADRV